jgi:hypothetical protein
MSSVVMAADLPLVTCGITGDAEKQATSCNFLALVDMINRIIRYLIMIALPLSAIAFAVAGWKYLTAGGNTGNIESAKKIFTSVAIGISVLLAGWLVFKLIADNFLSKEYKDSTFLTK